ncbi:hypothetical protein Patl1_01201 [Pistacia atlantica]|uniref:Uncharacterized protein n=1 Tax=Pistacia atlantica TaxID=434234 RepID=A0ACC1CBQ4_9ROSI|nr:hypothetical protein Patl1_01201 [Pistacia atlantica]
MSHVSDIKLIRTDTTLDLSQKAEKGMLFFLPFISLFYTMLISLSVIYNQCGTIKTRKGMIVPLRNIFY